MKKIFYSMLALAMAATAFTSCEDVPAPYETPNNAGTETSTFLSESFSSSLGKFTVHTPKGIAWVNKYNTATATGYVDKTNTESESYLVSPVLDFAKTDSAYLKFEYVFRYASNDGADKVLVTKKYTGNPATTVWEDITGTLTEGSDFTTFTTYSQNLDSKYMGDTCRIAFYYSASAKGSRTWEVKNVLVAKGKAPVVETPSTPDTPGTELAGTGEGTEKSPYNVERAMAILAAKTQTKDSVYVSGTISQIDELSTQYGNATYWISDDGKTDNQLQVYRGYGIAGSKFKAESDLKVGSKVVLKGVLTIYNEKGQVATGSKMLSLDGKTTAPSTEEPGTQPETGKAGTVGIDGTTVTLTAADVAAGETTVTIDLNTLNYANAAEVSKVDLSDGGTIVFDKGTGTNTPKFYTATKGVRLYKDGTITFTGINNIAKIAMKVDQYQTTTYTGNTDAAVTFNGKVAVYTNSTAASGSGVQLRVQTITITYAK